MTADVSDADLIERYVAAVALFGEQVQSIGDEEWDLPTPCAEWNTKAVVAHVVVGDAQLPDIFAGNEVGVVTEVDASILGPDPMSVWRGTALAAIESARGNGVLAADHPHPLGRIPGHQIVNYRLSDNLVHAWDLAIALSRPIDLPEELAEHALAFWQPLALRLEGSGFYDAALEPPEGASAAIRLLGLLGRR